MDNFNTLTCAELKVELKKYGQAVYGNKANLAQHLCADATYKLNWHGYPVFVIGVTDAGRHFHPISISICSNETAADFEFVFSSIKQIVEKLHNVRYNPTILVADGADAITNGFKSVFGPGIIRVMCWAHVLRAKK